MGLLTFDLLPELFTLVLVHTLGYPENSKKCLCLIHVLAALLENGKPRFLKLNMAIGGPKAAFRPFELFFQNCRFLFRHPLPRTPKH